MIVTVFLTSCSANYLKGLDRNVSSFRWQQHQRKVNCLDYYQTRGTFVYFFGDRKFYANFFWQQKNKDNCYLLLLNPLGITELKLDILKGKVYVTGNVNQKYTMTENRKIIDKFIKILIPLNELRQWILGLPGVAIDYKLDDQYLLKELNYNHNGKNWKVIYGNYDTRIMPNMPLNIEIIGNKQHIKLKMHDWILK